MNRHDPSSTTRRPRILRLFGAVLVALVISLTSWTPPAPAAAAGDWLSGASGPWGSDGSLGTWRGNEVEIGGTWVNSPTLPTLQPGAELGSWTKPLDVAIAPPDGTWQGWAAEAAGAHDAFFREIFANLATLRAGRQTTYVRPYYELNGGFFWKVTSADVANFKTAWIRMAAIAREEFPGVKLVYNVVCDTQAVTTAAYPGSQYVDVGGIDTYNEWPWTSTQADFDTKVANNGLSHLQSFFASQGVPIAINEWGNRGDVRTAANGGGGESPQYIRSIHGWFAANAGTGPGQMIYEIYFNLWPENYQLYPLANTVQPQTAAEYANVF